MEAGGIKQTLNHLSLKEKKKERTKEQTPLLMFSDGSNSVYNFLDPSCNKVHQQEIPALSGATVNFSKDDWLILSLARKKQLVLFNLLTKETFYLPGMDFAVFADAFSPAPISPDCTIVAIESLFPDRCNIGTIGIEDECWDSRKLQNDLPFVVAYSSPFLYNGKFYFLGQDGNLGVYDHHKDEWSSNVLCQINFNSLKIITLC